MLGEMINGTSSENFKNYRDNYNSRHYRNNINCNIWILWFDFAMVYIFGMFHN